MFFLVFFQQGDFCLASLFGHFNKEDFLANAIFLSFPLKTLLHPNYTKETFLPKAGCENLSKNSSQQQNEKSLPTRHETCTHRKH